MKARKHFLNKRDETMMMKTIFPTLLIVLSLAGFHRAAEGALIRHTFTGTITAIENEQPPAPWDGVHIGSIWKVSYVFDTGTPDIAPSPGEGFYVIDNGFVSVDGAGQEAVFGEIEVLNQNVDSYHVSLFNLPIGGGGLFLGGVNPIQSDDIPINIDLPLWNQAQSFQFGGGPAGFQYFLWGDVLSFTSEVVPGPSTWGLGLVSVIFFKRRHRRDSSC